MYLSNRDLWWAIEQGKLIVKPPPTKIDPTSIDLHLDSIDEARIWDEARYRKDRGISGDQGAELRIGKFRYGEFADKYLKPLPDFSKDANECRRGNEAIIRTGGFILWQTKETVGTPEFGANPICFINGKSTLARTGIVVHLTAPTIHASWTGKVTLEVANFGPFDLVLEEGDPVAQLTVAAITSSPNESMKKAGSITFGQTDVGGAE